MRTKREKLVIVEIKNDRTLLSEHWVAESQIQEYLNAFTDFVSCCRIRHKITKTKAVKAKSEEGCAGYQYCWIDGKFQIIPIDYTK
jgi:hypothetical protein